jgi:hypothetical protein
MKTFVSLFGKLLILTCLGLSIHAQAAPIPANITLNAEVTPYLKARFDSGYGNSLRMVYKPEDNTYAPAIAKVYFNSNDFTHDMQVTWHGTETINLQPGSESIKVRMRIYKDGTAPGPWLAYQVAQAIPASEMNWNPAINDSDRFTIEIQALPNQGRKPLGYYWGKQTISFAQTP